MRKEIFLIPILAMLVISLGVARSDIVIGETHVFYEGLIKYTVSKYIEVDFGVGWRDLVAVESIRPGETKQVTLSFNQQTTYVYVTENTNIGVKLAIGIPSNSNIQNIGITFTGGSVIISRGSYGDIKEMELTEIFVPTSLSATIQVPLRTAPGQRSEGIILCVYDSTLSNSVCPAL